MKQQWTVIIMIWILWQTKKIHAFLLWTTTTNLDRVWQTTHIIKWNGNFVHHHFFLSNVVNKFEDLNFESESDFISFHFTSFFFYIFMFQIKWIIYILEQWKKNKHEEINNNKIVMIFFMIVLFVYLFVHWRLRWWWWPLLQSMININIIIHDDDSDQNQINQITGD